VKVAWPHPGDLQALQESEQGEAIAGVAPIALGGVFLEVELLLLEYELVQEPI
jgi:hypothetical protein